MTSESPKSGRPRSSAALLCLLSGLAVAVLYVGRAAFIPVALALLFALLLSGPVEALHRKGLPRTVSALLILAVFLGLLGGAVNLLWDPAQQWLAAAPRTSLTIQKKLGPLARVIHRIDVVTSRAGSITSPGTGAAKTAPAPSNSDALLAETRSALVATTTVIILTLFLLAAGVPVLARMSAAFASNTHASQVLRVIEAIRGEVGRYYATIALINLGLGTATFGAMLALGMPNPALWGVLAAVLNFIPYVGSATTLIILTIVAFVSFDGIERVLAVAGAYLGLATIEGQIIEPLFIGQRLSLSPVIVFLALWFGGWFWGIAGIVLAIPSLVALKVAAEHSEHGQALMEFLSPTMAKRFRSLRVTPKGESPKTTP